MPALVVDASAGVELLLRTDPGRRIAEQLRSSTAAAVPAHFDAEVFSVLGRLVRAGELADDRVSPLLAQLARAPIQRFPISPLLVEAWELRHNVALRDALYVVLARRLEATLVTADRRLARVAGSNIAVTVVG